MSKSHGLVGAGLDNRTLQWHRNRSLVLIIVTISVPFIILASILFIHLTKSFQQFDIQRNSTLAIKETIELLPDLNALLSLSAAKAHTLDSNIDQRYQQSFNRFDRGLVKLEQRVASLNQDRAEEQMSLLIGTWKELRVTPGTGIEDIDGPFDNVNLTVTQLYQTISVILSGQLTATAAGLNIHDLIRPVLSTTRDLRSQVSSITNINTYSSSRSGFIPSADAGRLDQNWERIQENNHLLQSQIIQLSHHGLAEDSVNIIIETQKIIDDFLFEIEEKILINPVVNLTWQDGLDIGIRGLNAIQIIDQTLVNQALSINIKQTSRLYVHATIYTIALLGSYILILTLSIFVYRSNFAAEQAKEESAAKSLFLARMGHEIRTPMNGVLGLTELLRDTQPSAKQKEYIELIESAGKSLIILINDILDYAKMEAGKMELSEGSFNLAALMYESVHMFSLRADEQQTIIIAHLDPQIPETFIADSTRLRQVIINLISNAIKFTQQGSIQVNATLEDNSDPLKPIVRIEIRDTGIGIPEESRENIFSMFSQVNSNMTKQAGGTGLGLSICREIIALMNGDIGVESNDPQGTVFWFTLPLSTTNEKSLKQRSKKSILNTALLFDPNKQLSPYIKHDTEYNNVILAHSFNSTQERLKLLDSQNTLPQILVVMGLDANDQLFEFCRQIKQSFPQLHIRLLSGIREEERSTTDHFPFIDSVIHRSVFTANHLARLFDPLTDSMHSAHHQAIKPSEMQFSRALNVLIAEDNDVNQLVAKGLLSKLGAANIITVNNGAEAVAAYKENKDNLDLILMDLDMPEMDGFAATRIIRQQTKSGEPDVVILALSAHALPQYGQMVRDAGMNGYLAKPITLWSLFNTIEEHMNAPGNYQQKAIQS